MDIKHTQQSPNYKLKIRDANAVVAMHCLYTLPQTREGDDLNAATLFTATAARVGDNNG